jgi:hypothetical protein
MASMIKQVQDWDRDDEGKLVSRDVGVQVDNLELETLAADFDYGPEVYDRARRLFMADLKLAGASLRQLERWFGVDRQTLCRAFAGHETPDRPGGCGKYHRRLVEVVESNPDAFVDLVRAIQDKAGTTAGTAHLLFALGSRCRSAETALGQTRRSRKKVC